MGSLKNPAEHPHVAFLAFPFGTHAAPVHALACHLAASFPASCVSFFGTCKSNAPLARLSDHLHNLKLYDVTDGPPEGHVAGTSNPEKEIELFFKVAHENFVGGIEVAEREVGARVSCVVGDGFLWFAGDMAEKMGVPWVAVWTGGAASLSAHLHTDLIREAVGCGHQAIAEHGEQSLSIIPGLSDFRVRDLQEGVVAGNLSSVFAVLLHKMGQELQKATAVIINTFDGLEQEVVSHLRTQFRSCLPIGPLNSLSDATHADPFACLPWLDKQPPASVTYIAFGTFLCPPEEEVVELAAALEATKAPFVWSLKDRFADRLPAGFLEATASQGKVVTWAPQTDILGHVATGVFVTHCGWNSVMESVGGGVPMMCRPFLGDQRLNARAVSHSWRIGVAVDGGGLRKDWVVEGLDKILGTVEGEKMRERAGVLKGFAKKAFGPDGCSVKNLEAFSATACGL